MIPADSYESADRYDSVVTRLRAAGCVFAEDEARLLVEAASSPEELEQSVRLRVEGLPLEHVLGWAEFDGLRLRIGPGVFVPRRRSEFLVEQCALVAAGVDRPAGPAVVVDLCCGCGAIGAALAARVLGTTVYAVDADPAAVACARLNLPGGHVHVGDLYAALPAEVREQVDIVVAVAPYVPTDAIATMPTEARLYEPRAALDGGTDGLEVVRRIAAGAAEWLAPTGHVLVEVGRDQAGAAAAAFAAAGLVSRTATGDDDETVVIATNLSGGFVSVSP